MGHSALAWISAGIGIVVGYLIVYALARILAARARTLAKRHPETTLWQIVAVAAAATRGWVIFLLAIAIGLRWLHFPQIAKVLTWAIVALVGIQFALWISKAVVAWMSRATPEGSMQKTNPIIYAILTWAVEMLVWVTLLLILLAQAGVHIGAFVASLGVGGLAVAMAAKNVLEDLFASISIGLDKPFEQGEFIMFGSELGTVNKVGVKSTRIQSLSGEELAISNSQLLQNLTHNFSRMQTRRVVFGFHVRLDTPREKVDEVTRTVNDIIDAQEQTRRDRGHFIAIEPEGFRYEFVYYKLVPGYTPYCDTQQAINLAILAALESMDVKLAMPMRMLYSPDQAPDNALAIEGSSSPSATRN
jgi:small-conductance mechanosensitive channel